MLKLTKYRCRFQILKVSFIFILFIFSSRLLLAQSFSKPNLTFQVTANKTKIEKEDLVEISADKPVQLAVGIKRSSGNVQELIKDLKLGFHVITPWNLTVDKNGLVKAQYTKQELPRNGSLNKGIISISYGFNGDKEIGFQLVTFAVITDSNFYAPPIEQGQLGNGSVQNPATPLEEDSSPEAISENLLNPESAGDNSAILPEFDTEGNAKKSPPQNEIEENSDFIDYEAIKKQIQSSETPPSDPSLKMTEEEQRLYNEALSQP